MEADAVDVLHRHPGKRPLRRRDLGRHPNVLPDGRIVTVGAAGESGEQSPLQIQVVVNWFEELKRKAR